MEKKREIKRSSEKTFEGSAPQEFFSKGYFLEARGSNYGRPDMVTGEPLFSPYTEEFYLGRSRLLVSSLLRAITGVKNVIVLGCARGYMVQAFQERNIDAVGVDISEWAIENGAPSVAGKLYCGDVCDLSMWDDDEFDLVVALDVLEHIRVPDLYKALDETCRVGKVIVFDAPIDIDDTMPDQSDGTDKSHVSVYSKAWWITEFLKRGYDPISVQEFTYPEEKAESRWPDRHDHGVTIYLRPTRLPPTATTVPTITVKSGGKDFRILWWSNSPWVGTGYGVGTKHVVYPLNKHYDVRCLSYYGQQWSALNYNGLVCHGSLYDKFGIDAAQLLCNNRRWRPHLMITLFDIWLGDSPLLGGNKDWFTKIHPYWVPYFPIDTQPIAPPVLNQARQAYQCVAMSQFGRRQLEMEGISAKYIPHGVDTNVYHPPEDKAAAAMNLLETSEPLLAKDPLPWPEGSFIIGKVGANKDVPPRKGYDRDFKALEIFFDQNPDARRDTRMYLHTMANFPGGVPLGHLADINNIADHIRVTEPFLVWCGLMPRDMSRMYGGFDVLLNASRSEGFGMPINEAAACGVPTIATDFTSMTELVKGHGWLVNSLKNAGGFETFDTTLLMSEYAIPDEFQIAEAIGEAYNSPDKVRDFGEKSREFSLDYDWDNVITPLWIELIEELRERMRVKPKEERRIL